MLVRCFLDRIGNGLMAQYVREISRSVAIRFLQPVVIRLIMPLINVSVTNPGFDAAPIINNVHIMILCVVGEG